MQAESFDLPGRTAAEEAQAFHELDRINRAFRFTEPFKGTLPRWLGSVACARLEILDLGAGSGLLGRQLSAWAREQGWDWRFTNVDASANALVFGHATRPVIGSVLALPFADASFDLVVASQMTHHLSNDEVVTHWREAWRVTRDAVFISDVHRNAGLYALMWFGTRWLGIQQPVRDDAAISVKRGFHRREWREMARQAGLTGAKVWLFFGTRLMLQARKAH